MLRSYRLRVVLEIRPSASTSCSEYVTEAVKGLSGVRYPFVGCISFLSERLPFNARSAALVKVPVACTRRDWPSLSRWWLRASN